MKSMYPYETDIHSKYPVLKDIILYESPLYCIVEIDDEKINIIGTNTKYKTLQPEEVGIVGRMCNGVSIEPHTLSWKNY